MVGGILVFNIVNNIYHTPIHIPSDSKIWYNTVEITKGIKLKQQFNWIEWKLRTEKLLKESQTVTSNKCVCCTSVHVPVGVLDQGEQKFIG